MIKKYSHFPFYPLLLGLYPVLYLWAANLGQIDPGGVLRALLASFVFSLVILGGSFLLLRGTSKSAALAGLALLMFFTYENVYNLILKKSFFGFEIGYARLLLLFIILFIAGTILILRSRSSLRWIAPIANLAFAGLVVFSLFQIAFYQVKVTDWGKMFSPKPAPASKADPSLPDVYYIVPDGYARSDSLSSQFQYDNSKFIAALRQRGFYVSDCSLSNYAATSISLTSSLNMAYLEDLGVQTGCLPEKR